MKKGKSSKSNRRMNSSLPSSRNQKYSNITLFNRKEKEKETILNLKCQNTTSNFFNYKNSLPFVSKNKNKKMNNTSYSKKLYNNNNKNNFNNNFNNNISKMNVTNYTKTTKMKYNTTKFFRNKFFF